MSDCRQRMPVVFIGHGSPMLAVNETWGGEFHQWAQLLPRPRAIVVCSAHWQTPGIVHGAIQRHDHIIHDFHGFPEALYDLRYPAPGAPDCARTLVRLLTPRYCVAASGRGIDHGVWAPLLHMWPRSEVPVLQISLPSAFTDAELMDLGRALAPLREQGILIIASGALTHNLKEAFVRHDDRPPDWVQAFDSWVADSVQTDREQLPGWREKAPFAGRNHPTPEHFRPLLLAAGAAGRDVARFPIAGFELGVISRRCIQFG